MAEGWPPGELINVEVVMKFEHVELERVVERSLQGRPRWEPASHKFVHAVEAVVFGGILGYWLFGLVSTLL